jgi:hypothetical protein
MTGMEHTMKVYTIDQTGVTEIGETYGRPHSVTSLILLTPL